MIEILMLLSLGCLLGLVIAAVIVEAGCDKHREATLVDQIIGIIESEPERCRVETYNSMPKFTISGTRISSFCDIRLGGRHQPKHLIDPSRRLSRSEKRRLQKAIKAWAKKPIKDEVENV